MRTLVRTEDPALKRETTQAQRLEVSNNQNETVGLVLVASRHNVRLSIT